jgi:hypothetical protein
MPASLPAILQCLLCACLAQTRTEIRFSESPASDAHWSAAGGVPRAHILGRCRLRLQPLVGRHSLTTLADLVNERLTPRARAFLMGALGLSSRNVNPALNSISRAGFALWLSRRDQGKVVQSEAILLELVLRGEVPGTIRQTSQVPASTSMGVVPAASPSIWMGTG